MNDNSALIIVAAITATPSIGAFILAAIAAIRADHAARVSVDNSGMLTALVPTVVALEKQTNSILAERDKVTKAAGDRIGEERGRAAATAEGEAKAAGLIEGQKQSQGSSNG